VITTEQALSAYSAATGFDPSAGPPGSNPTDNGSTLQTGLEYLLGTGLGGVQIAAFGELDISNTSQWQQALASLGPLMLGVGVDDASMQQFNDGQPFTVTPGSQPAQEDHCVILSGYQPGMYWCYTWGGLQGITPAWFQMNAYEVWAVASQSSLGGFGPPDPESVSQRVSEMGELDRPVVDERYDHGGAELLCPVDRGVHVLDLDVEDRPARRAHF
jgi:hypothetical protein